MERSLTRVILNDLWQFIKISPNFCQEWVFAVMFWVKSLNVMRILCNSEVCNSQVSKYKVVVSDKLLKLLQLALILFVQLSFGSGVILVEVEHSNSCGYLIEDGVERIYSSLILTILAQQLLASPFVYNVVLDRIIICQIHVAINQIWQIRKIYSQIIFVIIEPFIRICISYIFEVHPEVRQQQSWDLTQSSQLPIPQLYSRWLDFNLQKWWENLFVNGIWPLVICLDSWQIVEMVSDSQQISILVLSVRVKSLQQISEFSKEEIDQCNISQGKIIISHIVLQLAKFVFSLLIGGFLELLSLRVKKGFNNRLCDVFQNTKQVVDLSLVVCIPSQKLLVTRFFDDVLDDGFGFSKFEFSVDEVGEVGVVKAKVDFVISEPVLPC